MFSVIFPGQGSQTVGMAKEFYDKYPLVKDIFSRADKALGYSISKIILDGPTTEINLTENTQPAIFVVSYSIFSVIKKIFQVDLNKAKYFAGHSLGEYSALACADGINFEDTVCLLNQRGKSMQTAVPVGVGSMIAILGKDIKEIEKILSENVQFKNCQIANDNCPGQIVVSGQKSALAKVVELSGAHGIKRALPLNVSAPFHSSMMAEAAARMKAVLDDIPFRNATVSVVPNVSAQPETDGTILKKLLIAQITGRVRWTDTIRLLDGKGVTQAIEIGAGKVLSGLVKRITDKIDCISLCAPQEIEDFVVQK